MNELTKEELEYIQKGLGLGLLCEHNPFHKVEIGKLMTKVKSMIDNYCDHNLLIGGADCVYCTKCKKEIFYHV